MGHGCPSQPHRCQLQDKALWAPPHCHKLELRPSCPLQPWCQAQETRTLLARLKSKFPPPLPQVQHSPRPRVCSPSSGWPQLSHLRNAEAVEVSGSGSSQPSQPPTQPARTDLLTSAHVGPPPKRRSQILPSLPCLEQQPAAPATPHREHL